MMPQNDTSWPEPHSSAAGNHVIECKCFENNKTSEEIYSDITCAMILDEVPARSND